MKLIGGGADGLVNGVGDVVLATAITNASGAYSFTGLAAGQYQVQFVAPSGFSFSPQHVGSNTLIDSDANTSTGKSQVIRPEEMSGQMGVELGRNAGFGSPGTSRRHARVVWTPTGG